MTFPCIFFPVQAFWYGIELTLKSDGIENNDSKCVVAYGDRTPTTNVLDTENPLQQPEIIKRVVGGAAKRTFP